MALNHLIMFMFFFKIYVVEHADKNDEEEADDNFNAVLDQED